MLRNLQRRAPSTRLIAGTPFVGLLASQIIADTATGDHGPGLLYDEALANPGQRLRVVITSPPVDGDLFVYEDGSVEFSGAAAGVYTVGYTPYVFNTALTPDTATINYGAVDATAAGTTLTGTAMLTPGAATGQSNATAPGATLTGDADLQPGAATGGTGNQDATALGATLTGTGALTPGTASGNIADVALSPADIAAIADAVWSHPDAASLASRLAEAWARLGLDPARPVVQDDNSISFGAVLMALSQSGGTVTVTRQ